MVQEELNIYPAELAPLKDGLVTAPPPPSALHPNPAIFHAAI
jgi:hypothetical protein